MKLIKRNDIRWDIVRRTAKSKPWWIVGWPITAHKGTARNLFRASKDYNNGIRPYIEVRIPFTPKVTWTWDGEYTKDAMYPVVSHSTLRFYWNGWLWFWRES